MPKPTAEQIAHSKEMILLHCQFKANDGKILPIRTVHVAQYKRTDDFWHVKVFVAGGIGMITDITHHVGIVGGFKFLKGNSLIGIRQTTNAADTVGEVLGVQDMRTEVI